MKEQSTYKDRSWQVTLLFAIVGVLIVIGYSYLSSYAVESDPAQDSNYQSYDDWQDEQRQDAKSYSQDDEYGRYDTPTEEEYNQ